VYLGNFGNKERWRFFQRERERKTGTLKSKRRHRKEILINTSPFEGVGFYIC
jgi:hypothetical protein